MKLKIKTTNQSVWITLTSLISMQLHYIHQLRREFTIQLVLAKH
ncbi:MAG: hypothetical protein RJB37_2464 [Pseudomonadota bacterium]